jgi:hypothetical protein
MTKLEALALFIFFELLICDSLIHSCAILSVQFTEPSGATTDNVKKCEKNFFEVDPVKNYPPG